MDAARGKRSRARTACEWFGAGLLASALVACGGGGGAIEGAQGVAQVVVIGLPGDSTASLQWTPSADPRVRGYRLYVGTASRSYGLNNGPGIDVGAATSYQFQNLQAGFTYYFAVTAYDAVANESDFSNEAAKLIQ